MRICKTARAEFASVLTAKVRVIHGLHVRAFATARVFAATFTAFFFILSLNPRSTHHSVIASLISTDLNRVRSFAMSAQRCSRWHAFFHWDPCSPSQPHSIHARRGGLECEVCLLRQRHALQVRHLRRNSLSRRPSSVDMSRARAWRPHPAASGMPHLLLKVLLDVSVHKQRLLLRHVPCGTWHGRRPLRGGRRHRRHSLRHRAEAEHGAYAANDTPAGSCGGSRALLLLRRRQRLEPLVQHVTRARASCQ